MSSEQTSQPRSNKVYDEKPWYQKTLAIILLLILLWPIGLYLMWRYTSWSKGLKAIISIVLMVFGLAAASSIINPSPILSIDNLDEGNIVTDKETYTVRGSLSGLTKGVDVTINGESTMRNGEDFYLDVDLEEGDNQITVRAEGDGKADEVMFVITRTTEVDEDENEEDAGETIKNESAEEAASSTDELSSSPAATPPSSSSASQSTPASSPPQNSNPAPRPSGYQSIYDQYSARLRAECPRLSMMECAELNNEGVTKMAEYMYSASGTEGQYATYETWSGKLMDVYMVVVQ